MGMLFPLGIKIAKKKNQEKLFPWFWGVNGAASVCASVLAFAIALTAGISTAFWIGSFFYLFAFVLLYTESEKKVVFLK